MAITISQLRTFLAVVRSGSVTAAAEELVVTQPSVSAALSALSREVGVELTERVGRSIRPSPPGRAFALYASDVVGLLEQGTRAAQEAARAASCELRIAAVTTAGEYIVPPLIQTFSAAHPGVTLTVDVGNRERVFDRLTSHRSDVGIGGRPPSDGGLVGVKFLDNPIVVIASADDPLARRSSVDVEELCERPWLMREEGSGTRAMTEEFLVCHDLQPELLTLGSTGAIKQAVRAGLGISLQPRLIAGLEIELGLLATVDTRVDLPQRDWYVLRPARGPVRDPVEDFFAFLTGSEARAAIERSQLAGSHTSA